jgi:anthranilate phosphoribosyltransferase
MNFSIDVLNPLVKGVDLDRDLARDALKQILDGKVEGLLISSFLAALTTKGETADEMLGFVEAMIQAATLIEVPDNCIDIVGTGGDQLHTANISTMAALVVAGCGIPVAKHGNRAASSSVGSADVLEALGVRLDVTATTVQNCIRGANIGFMFAPTYHHALGYLVPIRRALGFRTVFNVLGPLANPAQVKRSVIGVAHREMMIKMASVLQQRAIDHVALINAADGLDELSLGAETHIIHIQGKTLREETLNVGMMLGLHHSVADIRGGDTKENVQIVLDFLNGKRDAVHDVVCANAALALIVSGAYQDFLSAFSAAQESVFSGLASQSLHNLVQISNN